MVDYVIAIPSYKRAETLKSKTLAMLKSNKINSKKINSKKIHIFDANNEEKKIYEETLNKIVMVK